MPRNLKNYSHDPGDPLDRLIAAWRQAPVVVERLSTDTRSRILDRVRATERPVRLGWAWAGVAATILVALVVPIWLTGNVGLAPEGTSADVADVASAPRIQAMRDADNVVFVIANGGTSHQVTRSTTPLPASSGATTVVDGVYVDRIDRAENLVFYRID